MKKTTTYSTCLAFASLALFGCSSNDNTEISSKQEAADFSQHSQALFGELGGAPYGVEMTINSDAPSKDLKLGTTVATGKFLKSGVGVIAGHGKFFANPGVQYTMYSDKSDVLLHGVIDDVSGDATSSFGYEVAAGNYCANLGVSKRLGEIAVITSPSSSSTKAQFGGSISLWGYKTSWSRLLNLSSSTAGKLAGTGLAIGDVNGDGKEDLVYFSSSLTSDLSNYDYSNFTVDVHLDMCSGTELRSDASAKVAYSMQVRAKVYVAQLDATGLPEIMVVRSWANKPGSSDGHTGIVQFFKYDAASKSLVESRDPIYGDNASELSSVSFADFDGDGDLDLVVGEPNYNPGLVDGQSGAAFTGRVRGYVNPGPGKAFVGNPSIDILGEQGGERFGSEVVASDLNADGYPDLVVGSAGNTSGTIRYGTVKVYLGSQDPNVLSKAPYWKRVDDTGSASYATQMGSSIVVEQMDKSGWKDIIVGAPNRRNDKTDGVGGVSIFRNQATSSYSECYTADKCLIDNKCYAAGETDAGNLCNVCDPTKDNFGWSEVVCNEIADECHEPVNACVPTTGCQVVAKKDGSACGAGNSCLNNALTMHVCQSGVCVEDTMSCGNYKCDAKVMLCPIDCSSTADCVNTQDMVCRASVCELNHAPIAVLDVSPLEVNAGDTIKLDGSNSYDPDKDALSYVWLIDDMSGKFSEPDAAVTSYTIDEAVPTGDYVIALKVTDSYGLSSKEVSSITIHVTGKKVDPENHAPVAVVDPLNVTIKYGESFTFDGSQSTDEDGDKLNYRWYLIEDNAKKQIGTDVQVTVNAPLDPDHVLPIKTVGVSLIVNDGELYSEEVTASLTFEPEDSPDVTIPIITSPKAGSDIYNPVVISGSVTGTGTVVISEKGKELCTAKVEDENWSCNVGDLSLGEHDILAVHVENGQASVAVPLNFTVIPGEGPVVAIPVITYPENGDVTGSKPLISGTVSAGEGEVYVWYKDGDIDSVLCTANSKETGVWNCIPNITLQDGATYTISASFEDTEGNIGDKSESVTFTVSSNKLTISSPSDGDVLDASEGIIVSGMSTTGEIVNVEVTVPSAAAEDAVVSTCTAKINSDGSWMCDLSRGILSDSRVFLPDGEYEINAVTVSGGQSYYDTVTIEVINNERNSNLSGNMRGGSCSSTPMRSNEAPLWLAVAGLLMIAVPLRRRQKV